MERANITDRRFKVAVIGTGKISEEHLRFLASEPSVDLMGVCDLSPSLAQYAATRFKARQAYSDAAQMLATVQPDVVHVLTPPHTHFKVAGQCLEAGAHVIIEKPVAPTRSEFLTLWELARSHERWLIEDHNYRFNQPIQKMERLVAGGALGAVRDVDVRMSLAIAAPGGRYTDPKLPHPSHKLPAGVIHEFITHLSYLLLRFMPDFDTVRATWSKLGKDSIFTFDDLDALVTKGSVHGRIRFSSQCGPECFIVTVRGTKGWAETDLFQPYLRVVRPRAGGKQLSPLINHLCNGLTLAAASATGFKNKVLQHTPYEGLSTFLRSTYAALASRQRPPVTFEDMDQTLQLIEKLVEGQNRAAA